MDKKWTSLESWMADISKSKEGSFLDNEDFISRGKILLADKDKLQAYNTAVDVGRNVFGLRSALGEVKSLMGEMGCTQCKIDETMKGVYKITFRPQGDIKSLGLTENDLPTFILSARDDIGMGAVNGIMNLDKLMAVVDDANGKTGFASAAAIGFRDIASQIRELKKGYYNKLSQAERIKNVASMSKGILRDIESSNGAIGSRNALAERKKAFDVNNVRREGAASKAGQIDWSYLVKQVYNLGSERSFKQGKGVPNQTQLQFARAVDNMIKDAYVCKDFASFERLVKNKYPGIYRSDYWTSGIAEMFATQYKLGFKQGGMSEGVALTSSFADVSTPGSASLLAERSTKKPQQNLRGYMSSGQHKSGENRTYTRAQRRGTADKGSNVPLYYGLQLSDRVIGEALSSIVKQKYNLPEKPTQKEIAKAFKDDPRLMDAIKGLTADASVYDIAIQKDFDVTDIKTKSVTKEAFEYQVKKLRDKAINKYFDRYTKKHPKKDMAAFEKAQGEFEKKYQASWEKAALSKILDLNKNEKITNFEDFKKQLNSADQGIVEISTLLNNPVFKAVGGTTIDSRSEVAPMMTELLGRAFEIEYADRLRKQGYTDENEIARIVDSTVWKDKNKRELRLKYAKGYSNIKPKNMLSNVMGMYYYITSEMQNKGMSSKDIVGEFRKAGLKGVIRSYGTNGNLEFNDAAKIFSEGPTEILNAFANFGRSQGIYHFEGNAFSEKGGVIQQLAALPFALEIARHTNTDYGGAGTDSHLHYGFKEIETIKNRAGLLRAAGEIEAAEALEKDLEQKQSLVGMKRERYNSYVKAIDNARKINFNGNVDDAKKDILEQGGLVLPLSYFIGKETRFDFNTGFNDGSVDAKKAQENAAFIIEKKRKEHFDSLTDEQKKFYGFTDYGDVPIAVATDRRYLHDNRGETQAGGMIVLPHANFGKEEINKAGRTVMHVDEMGMSNARMLHYLFNLGEYDRGDTFHAYAIGNKIADEQGRQIENVLGKGGEIYEQANTIELKDSNYFQTQGLSPEILNPNSNVYNPLFKGAIIMNRKDWISQILSKNKGKQRQRDLYKQLQAKYELSQGKIFKDFGKSKNYGAKNRILAQKIADLYTLGNKDFNGVGGVSGDIDRFPNIKGANDIINARLLLSSNNNFVGLGRVMVDPYLLRSIKGDFDGDMIGIASSYANTAVNEYAAKRIEDYLKTEKQRQKLMEDSIGQAEAQRIYDADNDVLAPWDNLPKGKAEELKSLSDLVVQGVQSLFVNSGKQYTGQYGDMAIGINHGLNELGLTNAMITGPKDVANIRNGLISQAFMALGKTSYQEAISSKKAGELLAKQFEQFRDGDLTPEKKEEIAQREMPKKLFQFYQAFRSGRNYIDRDIFRKNIIEPGRELGFFKEDDKGFFTTDTLGDIIPKSEAGREQLAEMAVASGMGEKKDEFIKQIKDGTFKFTSTLLEYMFFGDNGLDSLIKGKKPELNGLSGFIDNIYDYVEGKGIQSWRVSKHSGREIHDEDTINAMEAYGVFDPKKLSIAAGGVYTPSAQQRWRDLSNILRKEREGEYAGHGSPTSLLSAAFPFGAPSIDTFDFIQKLGEYGGQGKSFRETQSGRDYLNSNPDINEVMGSAEATIIGSFAHAMAETIMSSDANASLKDLINNINENPELKDTYSNLLNYYISTALPGEDIAAVGDDYKEEDLKYIFKDGETKKGFIKGSRGLALLENALIRAFGGATTALENIGDLEKNLIGTEVSLFGLHQDKITSGRADLLYMGTEVDTRTGKNVKVKRDGVDTDEDQRFLYVLDYKNTKSGNATPSEIMQTLMYAEDLRDLQTDIQNQMAQTGGIADAGTYWYNSRSETARKYISGINKRADDLRAKYGDDFNETEYRQSEEQKLMRLYDELKDGTVKIKTILQTIDKGGNLRRFMFDPSNEALKRTLATFDSGMALGEQEIQQLLSAGLQESGSKKLSQLTIADLKYTTFGVPADVKEYSDAMTKLVQVEEDIKDLEQERREAATIGNETRIKEINAEIQAKEKLLELDEDGITKGGLRKKARVAKEKLNDTEGNEMVETLVNNLRKDRYDSRSFSRERFLDKWGVAQSKQYAQLKAQETQLEKQIYDDELRMRGAVTGSDKNISAYRERIELNSEQLTEIRESLDKISKENEDNKKFGAEKEKIDAKEAIRLQRGQINSRINSGSVNTLWGALSDSVQYRFNSFLRFGALSKGIQSAVQALQKVINYAKQLDKVMTNLRITTGYSKEQAQSMMKTYADLASQISSTTTEVAGSAAEWLRQGYDIAEVNNLIVSTTYLSKLGFISMEEATKNLTSAMKGFKIEAADSMSIVDKLTNLDVNAATTAGEIATSLAQFANTASLSGIDLDQAAAMATTIMDVSQMSGSSAGAALKTIISRYGNVKSGAYVDMGSGDSDEAGDNLNDVEKVLKKVGISIRDTKSEFRDFGDVLEDLGNIWTTLDGVSKNAIATALAGVRQREAFVTLMNNMDKYHDLLEVSANSAGTAAKKYQSYQEQYEASQKRVQAAWESLANNKDLQQFLIKLNDFLSGMIKSLPYVIRYMSRFLALMNAYKLPDFLKRAGKFILPTGLGSFERTFAQRMSSDNKLYSPFESLAKNVFGFKPGDYAKSGGGSGASNVFRGLEQALRDNTKATQDNTSATRGKGQVGTSGKGGAAPTLGKGEVMLGNGLIVDEETKELGRKGISITKKYDRRLNKERDKLLKTPEFRKLSQKEQDAKLSELYKSNEEERTKALKAAVSEKQKRDENLTKGMSDKIMRDYLWRGMREDEKFLKGLKSQTSYYYKGEKIDEALVKMAQEDVDAGKWTKDDLDLLENYTTKTTYRDSKGRIVLNQKVQRAQNNVQAGKSAKAAGAAAAAQAAMQGVAGAITGYLTASTTTKVDTGRKDAKGNHIYQEYEMDESTANFARGTTSAATGIASMVSPVLGQIVGAGMDALWKYALGPIIEKDKIDRQQRVADANARLSFIKGTESATKTLAEISKKGINTAGEQSEWETQIDTLKKALSGTSETDAEARKSMTRYLKENINLAEYGIDQDADIYTIIDQMKGNQESQIALTQALLVAEMEASHQELVASKEDEISKIYDTMNSAQNKYNEDLENRAKLAGWRVGLTNFAGATAAGAGIGSAFGPWGTLIGAIGGSIVGTISGIALGNATYQAIMEDALDEGFSVPTRIDTLEERIQEEYAKGEAADQEMIEQLQSILDVTKSSYEQLKAIYKELDIDLLKVSATKAQYNGQYLTTMTDYELKNILGLDAVKKIIIDQYVADGGSTGLLDFNADGTYSDWMNSVFNSMLTQEGMEQFKKLFSGEAYTLSEALGLPSGGEYTKKIITNFMNAIGVSSEEELAEMAEKFGNILLSDWLSSSSELDTKIKNIASQISDWASSSKTISEKQNSIIENFPQLTRYLGDSVRLMQELTSLTKAYSEIEIRSKFNDITSSTDIYEDFLKTIKEEEGLGNEVIQLLTENSSFSKITNLGGLMDWLVNNGYSEGTNKDIYDYLQKYFENVELISDYEKEQLNTAIEAQKYLLDEELQNLQSQKEALEQINEQRKYENELVEARLKLESALEDKKRVWREGVGWVYESDQNAVKEAQENLDNLTRQKEISELDEEIAQLEREKSDLEAIQKEESLKAQQDLLSSYKQVWGTTTMDSFQAALSKELQGIGELVDVLITDEMKAKKDQKEAAIKDLRSQWLDEPEEGGLSLAALAEKVKNGTASAEEQAEYKRRATAYQNSYNDYVNSGAISKSDLSELNGFGDTSEFAQNVAVNAAGNTKIDREAAKEYYYIFPGRSGHSWYIEGTKYVMQRPATSNSPTADEQEGIFKDGDVYRALDLTSKGYPVGKIKDEAKGWGSVSGIPDGVYFTYHGKDHYFIVDDGKFYSGDSVKWKDNQYNIYDKMGEGRFTTDQINAYDPEYLAKNWNKKGTTDLSSSGLTGINELGTEAIITPSGTITALPSHTGIVPADITKNLWALGEVAPSIMRTMEAHLAPDTIGSSIFNSGSDESFNIDNLTMNVTADDTFDADEFVNSIKQRVALTRNTKR